MNDKKRIVKIPVNEDVFKKAHDGKSFIQIFSNFIRSNMFTDSEIVTLLLLLDFKGNSDSAFPSQNELARIRKRTRRNINNHIQKLKATGIFELDYSSGKSTPKYIFNDIEFVIVKQKKLHTNLEGEKNSSQGDEKNISQGVGNNFLTKNIYRRRNIFKNTLITLGEDIKKEDLLNLGFSEEAVMIAEELKDFKNIQFYQKLLNYRDKGKIPDNKIHTALWKAKDYNNVLEKDGLPQLNKPASMFTKYLKEALGVKKLF